jgi:holin-like protein
MARVAAGLALLLLFNFAGQVVAHHWRLPLPGALIGMVLLLAALLTVGRGWQNTVGAAAEPLIAHLSLFFIAPTLGAFYLADSLQAQLLPLFFVLFAGTALAMALLALLVRALAGRGPQQ